MIPQFKRIQAFTLIELLVVVAIIGVLAGMLFVAVNLVQDAAKATVCQSNLRQLSLAANGYGLDNNNAVPALYMMDGTWWNNRVSPYAEDNEKVMKGCPTRFRITSTDPFAWLNVRRWSKGTAYGIGGYAMNDAFSVVNFDTMIGGFFQSSNAYRIEPWARITEFTFGTISHASNRILIVDNGNGESLNLFEAYDSKVTDLADGTAPGDPQAWLKGAGRMKTAHPNFYFAESRHQGKAACVFVDGHTELIYPAKAIVAAYAPDRLGEF